MINSNISNAHNIPSEFPRLTTYLCRVRHLENHNSPFGVMYTSSYNCYNGKIVVSPAYGKPLSFSP